MSAKEKKERKTKNELMLSIKSIYIITYKH